MEHIPSYPSIYALGHKFLGELFSGPVIIEEGSDTSGVITAGSRDVGRFKILSQ